MTKTLTEQWREGKLKTGWYYTKHDDGKIYIWLCFKDDCSYIENPEVREILGPVPDYYDCKGLIYDSINLANARKRIDELVSKTDKLEKKLEISTKALSDIEDGYSEATGAGQTARKALKEMEGVK